MVSKAFCDQTPYMVDISGQVPGGFGSYQLCLEIALQQSNAAKYCVMYLPAITTVFNTRAMSRLGVCVPQACPTTSLISRATDVFQTLNLTGSIKVDCGEAEDIGAGYYVTIVFISLLLFLVAVATLTEVFFPKRVNEGTINLSQASFSRSQSQLLRDGSPELAIPSTNLRSILATFDLVANIRGLSMHNEARNFMTPFNGIRALCILWVMLYNSVMLPALNPGVDNPNELTEKLSENVLFSVVVGGTFAIDTFFFLSGFLASYSVFVPGTCGQSQHEDMTVRFFVMYILRRVLKVLPLYTLVVCTYMFIVPQVSGGPFWYTFLALVKPCKRNWWTNFLYVNNVYPWEARDVCMEWTWYLSAEMQFVVISPIFMTIFRYYYKRVAMVLLVVLLALSFILNGAFVNPGVRFTTPWMRFSPFVYGMLADMLSRTMQEHDTDDNTEVSRISSWIVTLRKKIAHRPLRIFIGTLSVSILLASMVLAWVSLSSAMNHDNFLTMSAGLSQAQQVFSSFGWGFALLLMFLPLSLGYYSVLQSFLSWHVWSIFSRLTLLCYLLNPIVVLTLAASSTVLPHGTPMTQLEGFCGSACITFFFAVLCHVLIERPVQNLMALASSIGTVKK